ncbi:MAG: formate--tetrahydrofolate ligase, partial [Gammaproteobacteria bacterium]|nr:formate--tetrahydrofolate ligase [Gammaproteobacteria bacterium]
RRRRRVVDVNDRSLRDITIGLGGSPNGFPRQDGFDIVVASEVMAIFCLATSINDLKERLGKIVVGYTRDQKPILARDLKAHGAMTVLLKDALSPNLVQTLENNPAIIHGGPFANIAHGCNSVIATRTALKLGDYVVTEAGFGADLGAEKFVDIKCRKAGLKPAAAVIVATVRALKYHGGVEVADLPTENVAALLKGMANLERHIANVRDRMGLPCVVSINHRAEDTPAEIAALQERATQLGVTILNSRHFAEGSAGATELAHEVVRLCEQPNKFSMMYEDSLPLWNKMKKVATELYGAADITADAKVRASIRSLQENGYGHYPVCVAKTQYSFSTDPKLRGAPSVPVLRALHEAFGYLPEEATLQVAEALNLSRAEIHGVITFYHDFRREPAGRTRLKLCRAEACQAMGSDALADEVSQKLAVGWHGTTRDGRVTLEPVFCLGLCSVAPAALVGTELVGRADWPRLQQALAKCEH